jgi:aspartyl/asparaginyl beta-hydroxylase (cupin superfamily)
MSNEARAEAPYYRTDGPYAGGAPYFYDVEQFPAASKVRQHWQMIREEYEDNCRRGTDGVADVFNPTGPRIPGWKSVNFQTYLWRYHRARRSFPATVALLESIPDLTSAFINLLEPHSAIPPHDGDSQAIVRFHMGLDVPPGDCGLRVGPERRQCSNGNVLAFCDAHNHEAWNATDRTRVVFIFDVMRPEYAQQKRTICANALAAAAVVWMETRSGIRPLPGPLRAGLRQSLALGFALLLPLQRSRLGAILQPRD